MYWEDTDAGGVVFYANYLKFFERARTEWLRALGVNQSQMASESGVVFVVSQTDVQYRSPARLDDILHIHTRIARLGRASVVFVQEAWRGEAQLVIGSIKIGAVDCRHFKPTSIPRSVYDVIRHAAHGEAA